MDTPRCKIKTPAKVNIRLKIMRRRSDGYHELVSIMVPVALFDILELTVSTRESVKITCQGFEVPTDERNLIYAAVEAFMTATGIKGGVSVHLIKNIPVAAGLGGGSSDTAAAFRALNRIYSNPLHVKELQDLAVKIGADVPFFLNPRPMLATGIGEILTPIEAWPEFWYVIITPPVRVSTAWVYENLKLELTTGEYDYIVNALKNGTFSISRILENDLEKVTSASFPVIHTLKKLLENAGAEGAIMSGSGPSVFGLFLSPEKARSATESLASMDLGDVFMVRGVGTGTCFIND